ncbi:MAG: YkgJ family cysteine cluster protein [Thiohalocapsa sp.]
MNKPTLDINCENCAAVCCRLEVLCITDTGVPEWYTRPSENGVRCMDRLDDGWCVALDRVNMCCGIYERRPLICREFEMGGADCVAERADFARQPRATTDVAADSATPWPNKS